MSNDDGVGSDSPERSSTDLLAELERVADHTGRERISCTYRCHSGDTFGGEWRGVAVAELLKEADPATTHLLAISTDGYCAPIPVLDALKTVVATERIDESSDADIGDTEAEKPDAGLPRLVGEELDSAETVRDLARLVPVTLSGEADPEPQQLDRDPQDLDIERPEIEVVG